MVSYHATVTGWCVGLGTNGHSNIQYGQTSVILLIHPSPWGDEILVVGDRNDKESHTINAMLGSTFVCGVCLKICFFFVFPENMKRRYMFCLEKQLWQPVQVFFLLQHVRCIDWLHIYVYDLSQRGLSSPQKVQLPVQVSWPAATELRSASSPFPSCHL